MADEDDVTLPSGAGAPVRYGAVGASDRDAMLEGVAKGNIHVAGSSSGDRFALSAASEQTRERQEELLRALEAKRRQRAVAVTTDDGEVRRRLRSMGEPVTLFGEGPGDRRDRLRRHLADLDARDGGEMELPEDAELLPDEPEVQTEVFYTEGVPELAVARHGIAAYSLPRAARRLFQERRVDAETRLAALDRSALAASRLEPDASQIGDERPINCVRFSPGDGGKLCLTAGWSGVAKVWETEGGPGGEPRSVISVRCHEDRVTGADFHPSASAEGLRSHLSTVLFASACADGAAHVWSGSGSLLRTLMGHVGRLGRLKFHPSGEYLATAGFDKTWRLWSVERGAELLCQEGASRAVYDVGFHPDGSLAASVGLEAHGRVWDLRTGRCEFSLVGHAKQCLAIDFAPNGYECVTGAGDHAARVWDLRRRECVYVVPAHAKLVSGVRYEPTTGGFFVTSSHDGSLGAWSARDFSKVATLRGHESAVMGADVAPGGGTVASVGYDRTLKLWRRGGGAEGGGGEGGDVEMAG